MRLSTANGTADFGKSALCHVHKWDFTGELTLNHKNIIFFTFAIDLFVQAYNNVFVHL